MRRGFVHIDAELESTTASATVDREPGRHLRKIADVLDSWIVDGYQVRDTSQQLQKRMRVVSLVLEKI